MFGAIIVGLKSLLIFDWDGTLMDTIALIVESVLWAAKMCDLPPPPVERIRYHIGMSFDKALAATFPELTPDQQKVLYETYRTYYFEHEAEKAPLYPHVIETLQYLRRAGHPLAVATSKSRLGLDRALTRFNLQDSFVMTRTAQETAPKPDPLMLQEILAYTGYAPETAWMIGDTTFDMNMANAAGVPGIAILHGVHTQAELATCQPRLFLNGIQDLRTAMSF